ncbi:hypothetical protein ACJJTC_003007 [Scirpophaga incertulas]
MMSPLIILQSLIISLGVQAFLLFIYFHYLGQLVITKFTSEFASQYDYIIVGSGTAGSVIGHRLATETDFKFIIIEAGSKSNNLFEIPALGPMLHSSIYDWQYETVPQENACLAMNNQKCRLPQGKIVGGSSKLNNMVHVRGNISHYIDWFRGKYSKIHIMHQFDFIENTMLHLNEMQYNSELATTMLDAAKELGYNVHNNTNFESGFSKVNLSQCNGKRWTISDNLDVSKHILYNTFVEKLILKTNLVRGVEVDILGKKHKIFANKGVILAAGSYNSPKILQLSGIGPSNLLNALNIPVISDLPVGANLQDHITTGFDLVLLNKSLTVDSMSLVNIFNVVEYFFNGKGPLTTAGCEIIGFVPTEDDETSKIQFMVIPVGISSDRGCYLRKALGVNDTVWNSYYVNLFDKHAVTILPILLHPKSIGEVNINSNDPKLPPKINPKYLSNKDDIAILVKGLKIIKKLVESKAMTKLGATLNLQHFPGCEMFELFSDLYWECYIRHLTLTSYHPVGTCSMGKREDSVVDTSFKVYGVKNLYVADASVLPTLPSGNINAAVAMMASLFFEDNIKLKPKINIFCLKLDYFLSYMVKMCFEHV